MTGWILASAGVLFGAYVVVQLVRYRGHGHWPSAVATVETAEVRRMQYDGSGHHYRPAITFSFLAAGERYSGEWIGPPFQSPQDTADLMQRNTPVGARLTVRYKPGDPSRNLLDMDYAPWDLAKPITLDL